MYTPRALHSPLTHIPPGTDTARHQRPPIHFVLGFAMLLVSHTALALQLEPVYTYFFSFAWWPYIVWIDGWVYWRTGQSLLITRPRTFLAAAGWSIAVWCLYEAFNFRVQNWYYVMTPAPVWAYHLNYAAGFATVLPGLFATTTLLSSFGLFRQWRTPPLLITHRVLGIVWGGGLLATLLPLLWPRLFFPLIWLSMALLWEPVVYRWRGQSVLADLARGEPQRLATLLMAGAINGALWEGWNVLTRTGWIYTIPWLDWFHVGEMPLAGYLGFPLLAIECAVLWSVLECCQLTGAPRSDAPPIAPRARRWRSVIAPIVAMGWSLLIFAGIDRWTASSHHLSLAALPGITAREVTSCAAVGWHYPYQLVQAVQQHGIGHVAAMLQLSATRVQALVAASQLSEFRGIGLTNLRLLQAAGITDIATLARQEPASLTAQLQQLGTDQDRRPPALDQVQRWIVAAQRWTARRAG